MRIVTGIQPTGELHFGNYFGMLRRTLDLTSAGESFLFIADYHALTAAQPPEQLRAQVRRLVIDLVACGIDPGTTALFRQSDVPEVTELMWILSNVTPIGLLERSHRYKDKIAQGLHPSHGLFSYPVLMASDILIYRATVVPVGIDQRQHLELTRELASRFNRKFGRVFELPQPRIPETGGAVPGVDGRKMSKSYGNAIAVFDDEVSMRRKIRAIVTDSRPVAAPKELEGTPLFELYRLFADPLESEDVRRRYRKGGLGYGELKERLSEAAWNYFAPARARRAELDRSPDRWREILGEGARRARAEAQETLAAARRLVGLD